MIAIIGTSKIFHGFNNCLQNRFGRSASSSGRDLDSLSIRRSSRPQGLAFFFNSSFGSDDEREGVLIKNRHRSRAELGVGVCWGGWDCSSVVEAGPRRSPGPSALPRVACAGGCVCV
ncbi:t111.1 [Tupaiid betaherpesvirus 1]|uniref:T111.1 n=1 Tax=Tupaiid herpesvirus 1 (strain 1) TaxID=10397 RepID=Q91TJ1_TUHV1|nr:t111.1 [Tupaiid betaherpesvirus 1]AAK57156.1 t111.1 [Tupaiid betaherpesvirus 1]